MATKKRSTKKPVAAKKPAPKPARAVPAPVTPGQVVQLPLAALREDPANIRVTFDAEKLKALAADIAGRGIEQPITVTADPDGKGHIIKHGARRFRAAKLAGLKVVPVIIVDPAAVTLAKGEDPGMRRLFDQFAENFQREDLNAIDLAHFYDRLRAAPPAGFGIKVAHIPDLLAANGLKEVSRSHIQNTLALLELPAWAQEYMRQGLLTPAHAAPIKYAMLSPNVLKIVQKELAKEMANAGKEDRDGDPTHAPSASELYRSVINTFDEEHIDLTNGPTHYKEDERVYYDPKRLTDAERAELRVVEMPGPWSGAGTQYFALATDVHKRMNAAAKEAYIAKREKQQQKQKAAAKNANGGKAPPDRGANPQRLHEHLHDHLQGWCRLHLPGGEDSATQLMLMAWLAHGAPEVQFMDDDEPRLTQGIHVSHDYSLHHAAKAARAYKLRHFLARDFHNPKDPIEVASEAFGQLRTWANALADHMLQERRIESPNVAILALHFGFKLDEHYRVTDEYLRLHTKAGLDALVKPLLKQHKELQAAWLKCSKGAQMRAFCVEHADAIGVPPDIRELWEELTAPDEEDEYLAEQATGGGKKKRGKKAANEDATAGEAVAGAAAGGDNDQLDEAAE